MTPSRDLKKELRRQALARRDGLDAAWRARAALDLAGAAAEIDPAPETVVSGFWPMRSEMDVRPLMEALAGRGARLCLPAILDRTTIVFRAFLRDAPLIDMGFGTQGPDATAAVLDPDLMLVPLAAFDGRGHRIGYGAGYYDRAIARLVARGRPPRLIGVAFDCQEVARVPEEPHDMALDEILTESGLRRFASTL
ncbi:5-formyltetrahydrofolate cyclo-ligase [Nitratireductor pacificus]|uniref:5-formyltetrahydrofolate cyclo-ligase n=1 Tax=Nitratireductor pacificus pht-3B TaxID=391937 RepID=K2N3R4_9HYPH|nr:5-formyltetrahydrofolate cyclo-ligase [Nitratireductor pacificus]EKF18918.1 5-formyltetrahydrofolate cyclo-ligase [Nitratireductor pacificus pht-3B]